RCRRAIGVDRTARRLLDDVLGAACVVPKFARAEPVDQTVPIGVTRGLMPTRDDLAHEPGAALRHPSQNEECAIDAAFLEQVEETARVLLDAQGIIVPT